MTPVVLVDDASRSRVRTALGETLLVEAGAGTGKTSVLVARILALVDSGLAELREIAAISFTEAAAAELRERIERALESEIVAEDPLVAARRELARTQLDEAAMTTIHGFAHRVLADHPLAAGLPLRFEVTDEIGASLLADRRFASFLDGLYDDADSRGLISAAVLFGVTPEHIKTLCRQIGERRGLDGKRVIVRASLPELVEEAVRALLEVAANAVCLGDTCADGEDLLLARLTELGQAVGELQGASDWLDQLRLLLELRPLRVGNLGRREAWPVVERDDVRAAIGAVEEQRTGAIGRIADAVMGAIGARLQEEVEAFAEERRRGGLLVFHDLLVQARALVVADRAIRAELQRRYRFILVDEFQDTDPLQLELLLTLGSDADSGALVPGRLFFVGDPMQSIYRFRGADLELYGATRARVGGEEPLRLETNFRSVPGIVGFVNEVFSRLVDPGDVPVALGAAVSSRPVQLHAARAANGRTSPIILIGGAEETLAAPERRERESKEIAATIVAAVSDGWPVEDDGELRPARYRDIAVLVPARTGLGELETALEDAGIEYRLGESALVYRSSEVRDLLAVLAAIEDRGDERDVVAALRTPAFGCTDRDLVDYRAIGGSWRLDEVAAGAPDAVAHALSELAQLRAERFTLGVVGTIEAVVERRRIRQLLAAGRHPSDALRRLEFVLERARGFLDAGGGSLGELLSFFAQEAEIGMRRLDPSFAGDELDAVRVLTVHGAKGLEFPIVMLAELGGASRARPRGAVVLGSPDGRIELSAGGDRETSGYAVLAAREAEELRREAVRLCYVAATRARDHLVVSLLHRPSPGEDGSLAELIAGALPDDLGARHIDRTVVRPEQGRLELAARPALEEAGYLAALERRAALQSRWATPRSIAATSLDENGGFAAAHRLPPARGGARGGGDDDLDTIESEDLPWRRARAGSRVGRAVHGVLQRVDLERGAEVHELARMLAEEEGCAPQVDAVARFAEAALASAVVAEAARNPTLRRELPFTVSFAGGLVNGIVDLVFETANGLTLVDYKTDALARASDAPDHARRYRLQAGCYALALTALSGLPVHRFVLVFLAPPAGAIEVEVPDLAAAVAAARAAIDEVFAAPLEVRG